MMRCAGCGEDWDYPSEICLGCGRDATFNRIEWKAEYGKPRSQA